MDRGLYVGELLWVNCFSAISTRVARFLRIAMHSLEGASRPRLSETKPKWFVFNTS